MSNIKKAILLGDYTDPKWHPLNGVDKEIIDILKEEMMVVCSEDYGALKLEYLKQFDLCISYVDCWKDKGSKDSVEALLAYVSGGGGLLTIHNGIILPNSYELSLMIGAKFTGHPSYRSLKYRIMAQNHRITEDVEAFELEDEPYQFAFDVFTEKTMLIEYESDDRLWPAAWAHEFGKGRIVYLAPGHSIASFENNMFRKLILRSAMWATKTI
jgi:type 1 glutamine amidotransferase